MLISHRFRFIYTKTVKTAGTSVEAYFEPFCLPDDDHVVAHERDQYEGASGVVGRRGANAHESKWYNHMPAAAIRDMVGDRVWGDYFKFCVVRNPFDKLISAFHMHQAGALPGGLPGAATPPCVAKAPASVWTRWFRASRTETPAAKSDSIVTGFRAWVKSGGWIDDRDKYLIAGQECVNYFVRFEHLQADLREVCVRLGLPCDLSRLPRLKSEYRRDRRPVADYYDRATRAMVEERYEYELRRFGYTFPE